MARVLIGIDGSDLAQHATQRAVELFGASHDVTLAEVVRPVVPMAAIPGTAFTPAAIVESDSLEGTTGAVIREAEAHVAAAARQLGAKAETKVVTGDPGSTLCRLAGEGNFDLVVVGSHGSGFLKRVLLGSVSHHVLHHAPCPVLVVRDAETPHETES